MRLLYLCHRVPYAPNRGDRIRAYHTLRVLRANGVSVHLIALAHDPEEYAERDRLASLVTSAEVIRTGGFGNRIRGALSLAGRTPLTHTLLSSPDMPAAIARAMTSFAPDLVWAFCSGMAPPALGPPLSALPFVLDMVDVDSAKWADYASTSKAPLKWLYARESRLLGAFERHAALESLATFVVTAHEAAALSALAPMAPVRVIGNGVDVDYFRRPAGTTRRQDVVFTGMFDYLPNERGAIWFATEVWPLVLARLPAARCLIVGANPAPRVRALHGASIVVTGRVDDVRPYLWGASAAVAPLSLARGTQNKVLEALAAGLPAVVTSAVATGLPPAVAGSVAIADTPAAFADAVLAQIASPTLVNMEQWSWERTLAPMLDVLDSVRP